MKHKYSSIMASSLTKVVSVAAIATMALNIIIPDHKQSETENRPLQTFPSWNTEHVLSGQYTKDLNTWFSDQFVCRDQNIHIKYLIQKTFDRKVVAYRISKFNDNQLVIDTLNEAIAKNKDVHGLIIHSDQGFQYTSFSYKAICESVGIQISMSRKGTPLDDSPMESYHSILKKETLYNNYITNLEEYIAIVEDWIEFYNTKRIKKRKRK